MQPGDSAAADGLARVSPNTRPSNHIFCNMKIDSLADLIPKFMEQYDPVAKDAIWKQHSTKFRDFWSRQILAPTKGVISDEACDSIIRILDRHGKGNTKTSEAVARTMVPQNIWRKLLNSFHTDENLARLLDSIFEEEEPVRKAELMDALYVANEGRKNRLTGETASVVNALLAAHDPLNNLAVVSLRHRKAQLDFLGSALPFKWDEASFGTRIVQTNLILREGTRALGLNGSARTLSCFWYFEPVKKLWQHEDTISLPDKQVAVSIPQDTEHEKSTESTSVEIRDSLKIQALLAEIGAKMGFKIWLPRSDRSRVLTAWKPKPEILLDQLDVGFDQTTMKTVEQIDVLWLKGRSIVRAFEVEHTTSVYSGLLRMADLLAMQPNLKVSLHIVAPTARREKVLQEIRRPVFALLGGGPLAEACTYLPYDAVNELGQNEHLVHLSDKVLDDYQERAEVD